MKKQILNHGTIHLHKKDNFFFRMEIILKYEDECENRENYHSGALHSVSFNHQFVSRKPP